MSGMRAGGQRGRPARSRGRPAQQRRRPGTVLPAVRALAERLAVEQGLVIWDLELAREAGEEILRVAVDRRGGIDADQIARLSETLSRQLDVEDAVPGDARYVLQVTSPGAERRLRTREQFDVCVGRPLRVTFRSGAEPVEGVMAEVTEEAVKVDRAGEAVWVPFDDISQARLTVPGA